MADKELEVYFKSMNELFRTEGWQTLISDLKNNADTINSVEHTKDDKDLYFRKGQLNILGAILNMEETTLAGQEDSERVEDYV
jgi:hypothetical protein|tara:strand:- start:2304 stop:2552 length:249 start_codon:yes stop_codon:yes gene_type:complete